MKFLVDTQLPAALARWMVTQGADAQHVLDAGVGLDRAADTIIWAHAAEAGRIVVSKDEDFFHLANRPMDTGRLIWVRMGNCRTTHLLARFAELWPALQQAFDDGQRIAELR